MQRLILFLGILWVAAGVPGAEGPRPLTSHPGNVFVEGEPVCIELDSHAGSDWVLLDYDGKVVRKGQKPGKKLLLGALPVGHYRLECPAAKNPLLTTIGVVAPLKAPVGESPVGIKAQMSFQFYGSRNYARADAVSLMALAGVGWVQNGLIWNLEDSMELARLGAEACARQGMKVLISTETTPKALQLPECFGSKTDKKFPRDLRAYYKHLLEAGRVMADSVQAWEIRGEPAGNGGYFLPNEIVAGERVAWLALKQKNRDFKLGIGVPTGHPEYISGLLENGIADCSDVWFFHSHLKDYHLKPDLVCRELLKTMPVWESEGSYESYPLRAGSRTEVGRDTAHKMVNDLGKFYARAIMNHTSVAFYFRFFTHTEVNGQMWGMVRNADLTPRPQYCALVAAGRFLAGANPLGRLTGFPDGVEACLFSTQTDGVDSQVVVAWNNRQACSVALPEGLLYDSIGRKIEADRSAFLLGEEPVYLVVRSIDLRKTLPWAPAGQPEWKQTVRHGRVCPVVINLTLPDSQKDIGHGTYVLYSGKPYKLPIELYNFSKEAVTGPVEVVLDAGLSSEGDASFAVRLPPLGRKVVTLPLQGKMTGPGESRQVSLQGDFGRAGQVSMNFRVGIRPGNRQKTTLLKTIPGYQNPDRWKDHAGVNTRIQKTRRDDWMEFRYTFGAPKNKVINLAWAGPLLRLSPEEQPGAETQGLSFILRQKSEGSLKFGIIVSEINGERFLRYFPVGDEKQLHSQNGVRINIPLAGMPPAAFNEKTRAAMAGNVLDIDRISGIEIVVWTKPHSEAAIAVKNMEWVLFGSDKPALPPQANGE